nr:RNA-directed DNA polymerase, eukaryota [Tanacetum cinerariifolium]
MFFAKEDDVGIFRTKEDDVEKISTSVFITNFPESVSAKDLFMSCKQYGHVMDSFIPIKRSKNGKSKNNTKKDRVDIKSSSSKLQMNNKSKLNDNRKLGQSYVGVVKGVNESVKGGFESTPTIVLGDECMRIGEVPNALLGRVKEFASLANLKMALSNEGFVDIKIKYMGELWVMMEFSSKESTKLFRDNVSTNAWFSQVIEANNELETDGRIAWVEVEGVPFKLWTVNTFKRIAVKWGEFLDFDDQEETCFNSKCLCIYMKSGRNVMEDFKITHKGKTYWIRAIETPGWVPDFEDEPEEEDHDEINSIDMDNKNQFLGLVGDENDEEEIPETVFENGDLANGQEEGEVLDKNGDKSEDPFNIYPLLNKKDIKENKENISGSSLNYPPGFTPSVQEEDVNNEKGVDGRKVNRKVHYDVFSGKQSYTKSKEDGNELKSLCHFKNSEIPRTGGSILGLLDEVVKVGQVMGYKMEGVISNMEEIIKSQGVKDRKKLLREYLNREIGKWKDEVVVMGDFNEVWYKSDRYGSVFNAHNADMFNSFILSSGLVEVSLGGSPFTWCHKSATKMSCIKNVKTHHKKELETVDAKIDEGKGDVEDIRTRREIINSLKRYDKLEAMEIAQKAKIKWAVEGDENSRFYHDSLDKVKREFLDHFTKRFSNPGEREASLFMDFPKQLNDDQQKELESCNSLFIALIPKIPDANLVKDFRPISLIGSIYKIIAKVLTNRLVRVLGEIVNEVQSAFIADRQILDGPFILNEVIKWCKVKKKQALIFKVDFEKAYDSVRWDFLDDGFKTRRPVIPIFIYFNHGSLHLSFQSVVDAGMFQALKLDALVNLSHMFYADDAVFIGQWNDTNITTLVHVLECFFRVSGLKINMGKSKIMGVHVDNAKVSRVAVKLDCLVLKAPFVYLCSIIGGNMNRLHALNDIVDRNKRRLSKWKMTSLSIGGRLTLVKLMLGSMPIFHMAMFKVPTGVLCTLEKIRSHFFNGHDISSKKVSWVYWKKILAQKDRGGLDGNTGKRTRTSNKSCWENILSEVNTLSEKDIELLKTPRGGAECDQMDELDRLIQSVRLTPMTDRLSWTLDSEGMFSVASVRSLIDNKILPTSDRKTKWINVVPIKVNVLAWNVMTDSLPTRFNISRRAGESP